MKKFIIYSIVLLGVVAGMSGCIKDDNNYDYEDLNEVQGTIQNFKDMYNIAVGQELVLAPTFKFTIDSINPDVSYEWYLDDQLLEEETGPAYTFKSDEDGEYSITFSVTDNKSGVKFAWSTRVKVMARYQRGWVILSDEAGKSALHFVLPSVTSYPVIYEGESFDRDSLLYHTVVKNVVTGLGSHPVGLMENLGNMDYSGELGIEVFDEIVVMQDRWEELNGNSLEHEVYTEEEFQDDLPADFSPMEAAMTYSAKAILDKNGKIYWNNKIDASDFHAGFYTSVGLNNNMRFSRLFQTYKLNDNYTTVIPALTRDDNSLVGIFDTGSCYGSTAITENSSRLSGNVYYVTETETDYFSNMKQEVVETLPAAYRKDYDVTIAYPSWVSLMRDPGTTDYDLRYFTWRVDARGTTPNVTVDAFYEKPLGHIADYRDMAVFNNKLYVVIADGNKLLYCQYGLNGNTGTDYTSQPVMELATLPANIKSLSANDVNYYAGRYDYCGQLGVALENGEFYIYSVKETKDKKTGITSAVSLKQEFPNEKVKDNNFGKIVDVLYKIGRGMSYMSFEF